MRTKRLVIDAMLVAMYVVLSNFVAINLGGIRITIDLLPIAVGAMLYGPVDGLIIGFLGNFLFQLLGPYGISVTTVLWALPDAVRGLLIGLFALKCPKPEVKRLMIALTVISVISTTVTTGVMYVDCLIFKYSFAAYSPYILARYAAGIIVAVVLSLVLIPLLKELRKITKMEPKPCG